MISLRPGTVEDLVQFYGEPLGELSRVVVADRDGEILGVAGLLREQTHWLAFSNAKPGLPAKTMYRAGLWVAKFADEVSAPVYAIAESCRSVPILERVGFTRINGDVFRYGSVSG